MEQGWIVALVRGRGFGFIRVKNRTAKKRKRDYFFHCSDLQGVEFDDLLRGQAVECKYYREQWRDDSRATQVRLADGAAAVAEDTPDDFGATAGRLYSSGG